MNFCTYFDKNYIPYGLTLLDSLNHHSEEFLLHIVCMDNSTFSFLKKLKPRNSKIYKISEVEESINGLKGAKKKIEIG